VVSTPTGSGPHPVDAPIEFSVPAGGGSYESVWAIVFGADDRVGAGDRIIGVVIADDSGKAHVPALPSGSDEAAHYEPEMRFQLATCRTTGGNCSAVGGTQWKASPPSK
jgi:hypothetical protein